MKWQSMIDFIDQLLVELVGGIISSFVFLLVVLYFMRPNLRISDVIVKQVNTFDGETEYTYMFKVINQSWFDAYEVEVELFEVNFYPAIAGGMHKRLIDLTLKRNYVRQIPGRKRLKRTDQLANHCVIFRTNTDLESILQDKRKCLQLQFTSKHGLTGLSRIHLKNYISLYSIKEGMFRFGNTFEIN
jgi:hypothetical protein